MVRGGWEMEVELCGAVQLEEMERGFVYCFLNGWLVDLSLACSYI